MKKTNKTEPETPVAEITIKFFKSDEDGNIKTDIQADKMGILAFNQLKLVADWYIENEFTDEERQKLADFKKEVEETAKQPK
jgi:hypothetical protein